MAHGINRIGKLDSLNINNMQVAALIQVVETSTTVRTGSFWISAMKFVHIKV